MIDKVIPYQQALELKQLGFNEPCLGSYYHAGKKLDIPASFKYIDYGEYNVLAPSYSQSFRWFREKYGLYQHIEYIKAADRYDLWVGHYMRYTKTYEEAELACLKELIEIVKGDNK